MMPEWLLLQMPSSVSAFAILGVATFVGSAMRAFSGFGSGLLMAPVFSLLMMPTDVVVVVMGINLLTTLQMLPEALRNVDWRLVLRLFIPSLLGVPVGLAMLHMVDPIIMRKTVSATVVVVALLMLAGWHYKGRRGLAQDASAGMLSGFMTAIGGIGGPPIILYMLSDRSLSISIMRSVCLVFFSLGQLATLLPLAAGGSLNLQQGVYIVILLPIAVVAALVGVALHRWSMGKHQEQVRRISVLILLTIGIMVLFI